MSQTISHSLATFLLLLFCQSVVAQSHLLIGEEFRVTSVNGNAFSGRVLQKGNWLKLNPGLNKIATAYDVTFKNKYGKNFGRIKSDIFILSFYLQVEGDYRLQYLKPANSKAAKKFIQNPIVSITDNQGNKIDSKQFFPDSQSLNLLHHNTVSKIEKQPSIQLISKAPEAKTSDKNKPLQSDAEERLLFWWQQASQQQRQSFLDKINQSN